jgi:beta-lactamase superfamily II metal-dependent hydrolase
VNASTYIAILDVGHGNSAVLVDQNHVVVIDTGRKNGLIDYLLEQNIKVIHTILLSHSDADHIGGLIGILSSGNFDIHEVRLNGDGRKSSKAWDYLAYELTQLNKKGKLRFEPTLTTNDTGSFDGPTVQVEILAPNPYLVTKGVGNNTRDGRRIETNTISSVIRLSTKADKIVVLPGDIDDIGLDLLIEEGIPLHASILVFPHHGGNAGDRVDMKEFTKKICLAVQPNHVIFSIDRNRTKLQPEVIRTVRKHASDVHIACTQLSYQCASAIPKGKLGHLTTAFAVGREGNRCCAGSFLVYFTQGTQILPRVIEHQDFILNNAAQALCQENG